ncbi:hypothetical protein [Streptomyces roseolus]|uniref:hypothetical protein n=1 Tax=Streptomyces roseolus TaxID=67358 RepID=UPI0016779D4D|nr:hypothetical protein [Streptomyces roseolus]GGR36564.1 hypothetical protein GCM10010282_31300 [Streptomyces roseolus]
MPFWLRFDMESSYDSLETHLDATEPYAPIHLNLFFQGLGSPGIVLLERRQALTTSRATRTGQIVGVARHACPADPGSTLRYRPAFAPLPPRHPLPAPLPADAVGVFLRQTAAHHRVSWTRPGR